jgi:hypothetical protein
MKNSKGENKGVEIIQKKVKLGNCVKNVQPAIYEHYVLLQEVFE